MPVSPAIRNWKRNAIAKSIGNSKRILPPYIVASQLKILIPVGTEMAIVVIAKKVTANEFIPTVNMWCAQTPALMKPIKMLAATIIG